MTIRDQALADIVAATSSEVLGQPVVIDGISVDCVKRDLTVEEAALLPSRNGLGIEGLRINVDRNLLLYQPAYNGLMVVDNREYEVNRIGTSGDLLRITLVRYTG